MEATLGVQQVKPSQSLVKTRRLEQNGRLATCFAILVELLDWASASPFNAAVITTIKGASRLKSFGPHFTNDLAACAWLGANNYSLENADDAPPGLATAKLLAAAPYVGWLWPRLEPLLTVALPPNALLLPEDFDTIGRPIRLAWGAGMMQPGIFDQFEWFDVERDVDCAFGLSALARPGTFHTKIMNAVMVDEETHEWVRWGKLTGGALGRGQTDAPAPMEV